VDLEAGAVFLEDRDVQKVELTVNFYLYGKPNLGVKNIETLK